MEEERKKHLPVPSNFVTLVQLQERWLEEKQRKQREKGKEEERTRREKKEEEERKRGDQENLMRQSENEERSKRNTLSRRRPVSRRNQSEKNSLTIVTIERKSEESQVGAIVVGDGERKIDDLNKKKKKKRNNNKSKWKKKGKARAEEDLTGGTEQSLPEYKDTEEKIPVVLTERDGEKEGVTSKFQRKGKNLVVNDMVCEKKVPVARSAEIGRKFKCISLTEIKGVSLTEIKGVSLTEMKGVSLTEIKGVSLTEIKGVSLIGGKGVNERYRGNMHGSDRKYNRGGSERLDSRRLQKPRDSSLVWVRKGDTSDVNVAGAWSSGGLAKAEKARRN